MSAACLGESMPLPPSVADLVRQFRAQKPARIWSLIVTLYGDAIVPRGGSLWVGSLIDIMALFGIDAGHVRTAISRLASDGWLTSEKRGRASYYRLSKRGEGVFLAATQRIFFDEAPPFDGRVRLVLLGSGLADPAGLRRALKDAGCAAFSASAYLSLNDLPPALVRRRGLQVLRVPVDAGVRAVAAAAWEFDALAAAYDAFVDRFAALEQAPADGSLAPDAALVARTLLVHAFRRIVLRDPGLPAGLLPPQWPGHAARRRAGAIYRRLLAPSEAYLDAHARNTHGPLPPPGPDLARRFAAGG